MLFTSSHVWDFPLSVTFCATNPPDRTRPFCRTLPDFYISRGTLFFSEHKMWYFKNDTQVLRVPQDRQFRRCVSSRLVSIYTASSFAKKKCQKSAPSAPCQQLLFKIAGSMSYVLAAVFSSSSHLGNAVALLWNYTLEIWTITKTSRTPLNVVLSSPG
jgi:hypothetical protein